MDPDWQTSAELEMRRRADIVARKRAEASHQYRFEQAANHIDGGANLAELLIRRVVRIDDIAGQIAAERPHLAGILSDVMKDNIRQARFQIAIYAAGG